MDYRLVQNFNQHGQNNGYSIHVSCSSDDLSVDSDDFDFEKYQADLDALETLRSDILCVNFSTSETHVRLLESIQDAQNSFDQVTSALRTAREQYETMQAFLQAQGIKSMDNFPSLAVPKLTGELLEDEKKSNEF